MSESYREIQQEDKAIPEELSWLYSLNKSELEKYITSRLKHETCKPAINLAQGEKPEEFIISAYDNGDEKFKRKCSSVLTDLLTSIYGQNDNKYISRLIHLLDRFVVSTETCIGIISGLANIGYLKKHEGCYDEDIHKQLLRALTVLQEGIDVNMVDFWKGHLKDPNYIDVAFVGLYTCDINSAIKALPDVLEIGMKNPEKLDTQLLMFYFIKKGMENYEKMGKTNFFNEVGDRLKYIRKPLIKYFLKVIDGFGLVPRKFIGNLKKISILSTPEKSPADEYERTLTMHLRPARSSSEVKEISKRRGVNVSHRVTDNTLLHEMGVKKQQDNISEIRNNMLKIQEKVAGIGICRNEKHKSWEYVLAP